MKNITSKSNENVIFIKSLNDKKNRKLHNKYYLEGIKVVDELLDMKMRQAIDITSIACSFDILKNTKGGLQIFERLKNLKDIQIYNLPADIFISIVGTITPQGILAVLDIPNTKLSDIDKDSNILILDRVQDPGNVGTIIRTANCFNVKNIICIEGTADVYSQKVLRSTMNNIVRVKIIEIMRNEILNDINKLKKYGYRIIGTSLKDAKPLSKEVLKGKCIYVLGNESNGMSKELENLCDELVKIPIEKSTESLNVAITAGIVLYKQYIVNKQKDIF